MIQIIDCMPGAGKSTWAINHMRENPDKKWMFVSPYKDQVGDGLLNGRIHEEAPEMDFRAPKVATRRNKSDHLEDLLADGHNVSITHALFNRITKYSVEKIKEQGYHVIIDETLDCISKYDLKKIPVGDIHGLITANILEYHEKDHSLTWNPNIPVLSVYEEIKDFCDNGEIFFYNKNVLIQRSRTKVLKEALSVIIMTYLFNKSFMYYWLEMNNIEWNYITPPMKNSNEALKENLRQNLVIVETPKKILDMQEPSSRGVYNQFSSTWYSKNGDKLPQMKTSMESVLRKRFRPVVDKTKVYWTTFKAYEEQLSGHGYTLGNSDCVEEGSFVSSNMRASNQYGDRNCCLYTVNVFPHMDIVRYIASFGLTVDQEGYALSQMLQFIYRGAVRNDEKMFLCVFSNRMRHMLQKWLYEQESWEQN